MQKPTNVRQKTDQGQNSSWLLASPSQKTSPMHPNGRRNGRTRSQRSLSHASAIAIHSTSSSATRTARIASASKTNQTPQAHQEPTYQPCCACIFSCLTPIAIGDRDSWTKIFAGRGGSQESPSLRSDILEYQHKEHLYS